MVMSVGNMEAGFVSYLADHVFQTIKWLELYTAYIFVIYCFKQNDYDFINTRLIELKFKRDKFSFF